RRRVGRRRERTEDDRVDEVRAADRRGLRVDLERRAEEGRPWHLIVRRVEAEDGGRRENALAHLAHPLLQAVTLTGGLERAQRPRDEERRLLEPAEVREDRGIAPGLHGEEDRLQRRSHVAAHARAVGRKPLEGLGHAGDVAWARIARHEVLDELASEEGPDVRVAEDLVEGGGEVLRTRAARGEHEPVEQLLRPRVVAG